MTGCVTAFCWGMSGWTAWCGYSLSHGRPWLTAHVTGGGWCCLVHPCHPATPLDCGSSPQ